MARDDLPLALRRSRRGVLAPSVSMAENLAQVHGQTPKKRVRFSDVDDAADALASATGLTPAIGRTSLHQQRPPSAERRRVSSPMPDGSSANGHSATGMPLPLSGPVHFLPLRQVLDGRVQRRIRRNGLSEEMNSISEEKRQRARDVKDEINRLKQDMAAKDEEIRRLQNETVMVDADRIQHLEQQIEELKRQLSRTSPAQDQSRSYDWTLAAKDPFAPDYMDTTDDAFGDETAAEIACSTPTRAARNSFPSPPLTSPLVPLTPSSRFGTPHSHVGVQACIPDPERVQLEDELASLQLELCKLNTTLESHSSLFSRLAERLSTAAKSAHSDADALPTPPPHAALEAEVENVLRMLSDRTAALLDLSASLADLGFPGTDASEMVSSLASGFRTARLELEYLTPGEITLPLSSHGAEVLDLLLTRLRDLAKKGREDDASIDEYHDLEVSLRQQLGARVSAMDGITAELARARELLSEKDSTVQDLEVSVSRLKGAVNGYIRDVAELESWVERMETENREAAASREAQLKEGRDTVAAKESRIAELEEKLAGTVADAADLQKKVDEAQKTRKSDLASQNKKHGAALALRDARVLELRSEIDRVNESLRTAHETIRKLRVEKSSLEAKMTEERKKAKGVIDSMKDELQRMVRMSQDFLETPKKQQSRPHRDSDAARDSGIGGTVSSDARERERVPSSPLAPGAVIRPGGLLSGDLVKRGPSKKRRRYDSGLGFLDDEEVAE